MPIRAADLTENWTYNGGGSVEDIYRTLRTGLDGTPMATFQEMVDAGIMTDQQLWNLAHYVRSMAPEEAPQPSELIRAGLVAEEHIPVRLAMKQGGVELTVTRQDVGGETEMVEADYDGEDVTIAFNPRYLIDGVSAVDDDEVVIQTVEAFKPGLIHGASSDAFRYLLMPVRL